ECMRQDLLTVQLPKFSLHFDAVRSGGAQHVSGPSLDGFLVAGLPPSAVNQRVLSDAEKPGAKPAFCPIVGADLAKQLYEDVLNNVVGFKFGQATRTNVAEEDRPVDGVELPPPIGVLLANPHNDRNSGICA